MKRSRALALAGIVLGLFEVTSAQARDLYIVIDWGTGSWAHMVNDDGRGAYLGAACGYQLYATQNNVSVRVITGENRSPGQTSTLAETDYTPICRIY